MAEITLTDVKHQSGPTGTATAAAAITQGQLVSIVDGGVSPVVAGSTTAMDFTGIALHDSDSGGQLSYAKEGSIVKGSNISSVITTMEDTVWMGTADGTIANYSDLSLGDHLARIGFAWNSSTELYLQFKDTGEVKP